MTGKDDLKLPLRTGIYDIDIFHVAFSYIADATRLSFLAVCPLSRDIFYL